MTEQEHDNIRKLIAREIERTKQAIVSYKDMSKPVEPDCAIGRVSRMDAINNKSITEAALRTAQEKLRNLNVVEKKLNDPDFGVCISCKQAIPIGRIILRPQSRRCVRCAR